MLLEEQLEKLLLKNWASFIELKPFTSYVISLAKGVDLQVIYTDQEYPKNIQIKISRFKLTTEGFLILVEFIIPQGADTICGTSELLLTNGTFNHQKTIGILVKRTLYPSR